ncbi:unnamed protein product [Soboliphyme baturini]|uniref:THAP-type domain-containing protein n=1 Tax=Soboliphyme baturini TaxID=241478 RepID=A0A183IAL9_9BILA|nr:unnamed protein product [Soboliphyme baturini]
MSQRRCLVPHCPSSGTSTLMFGLPRDDVRRHLWLRKLGVADVPKSTNPDGDGGNSLFVCKRHFDDEQIYKAGHRVLLRPNAVPQQIE